MTLYRPPTAFSLSAAKGKRRPRVKDDAYLAWIRTLPCVITGQYGVEAAHIRYASIEWGKRETGKSEKPSDKWVIPLSPDKHREQHTMNERTFWAINRTDPLRIAAALFMCDLNTEVAELIIENHRRTSGLIGGVL